MQSLTHLLKTLISVYVLVLSVSKANALETDNYLAWDRELEDSSETINRFLREKIDLTLAKASNLMSCEDLTRKVGSHLRSRLVHDNPVENWLMEELTPEQVYPTTIHYIEQSIYRDPFRFYIPAFGLAANVQVNGFYFGTDKLSHFASTGKDYWEVYLNEIRKGASEKAAVEKAIMFGVLDENRVHGFWASGVLSYADLEANYQGFLFFKNLCAHFTQENGGWTLKIAPDITNYINANWDETHLESYYLPKNWEKVSKVIKEEYCDRTPRAYDRNGSPSSPSMNFIAELQSAKHPQVPVAQAYADLCASHLSEVE